MVSAEWLQKAELFGALNHSQLNTLLAQSHVEDCPEGKIIFQQREEALHLYVLIQGSVELTVKTEEKTDFMTSKIEKEGAVFGSPSLMERCRYNVSAVCLKPSRVLILDSNHIKKKMEQDPKMGIEVMKKLASLYFYRLNDLRSGISNLLKLKTP
jgi:CRP/FNR family transcriptional regulator, cyclic AMP receptor protein